MVDAEKVPRDLGVVPVSDLRECLSYVIDGLAVHGKAVRVTRRGKPVAVLMDFDAFESLVDDLDDADDYRALAEHDAEQARGERNG